MVKDEFIKDVEELIELNESLIKEHGEDEALQFNLDYLKGYLEFLKKEQKEEDSNDKNI